MIKAFFSVVILIHGLIHFMGFAKAFGYGNITQLTKQISKPIGALWLVTAIMFITVAVLFFIKKEWWIPGFLAILFSQALIFISWKDAKFGTIINIIILIALISNFEDWKFNKKIPGDVTVTMSQPTTH